MTGLPPADDIIVNRTTTQVKGTSRMPVLTEPTPHVHASFVEAIREYREEGRYSRLEPATLAGPRIP